MKRFLNYILSLLIISSSLYSCTTDEIDSVQKSATAQKDEVRQIQVTMPTFTNIYESRTRTVIDDSDAESMQFVWAENDTIGIFPSEGFQVAFPMNSGAGSKSASFDGGGWGLKSTSAYSAYYPLIGQFYLDKTLIPISMSGQTQNGNNSHAHIGAYDYMAAINSTVGGNGSVSFSFQSLVSVIHFSITMPQAGKYTKLMLESNGNLVVKGSLNLTNGEVVATQESPVQELTLKDVTLTTDNLVLDAYVAIRSIDLTGHSLTAKIYDEDGNIYVIDRDLGNREFVAGNIYHADRNAILSGESTGLPTVIINTPANVSITSKDNWLEDPSSIVILNPDGTLDYEASDLSIRGRGNSTWGYPKKPYALKLGSKSEILGMKKHKRWCLLANWMDRTLLRNDMAFQIAKQTDLAWTPSGKFVEVILNGNHIGNYYLCEQIKIDKNRLNIAEMKATDIDGDAITGGYLMELDIYYDEVNKFKSGTKDLPYMFKSPDEEVLQPQQLEYFQNYINTMESLLYADNWLESREYANYMDIGSFVDWWFVYELSMNSEPNHPKSSYVHKDRLGKLKAGPVWDFDWATFMPGKANNYTIKSAIYYGRLFSDPTFVTEVKSRWATYKTRFEQVPAYVRTVAAQIKKSNEQDKAMWPMSANSVGATNGDRDLSFDDAVERIISAYTAKLNWIDEKITDM